MNLREYFDKAPTYEAFREQVVKNQNILDEVHANPNLTSADLKFFRSITPLKVLVIGADWCPDVVHTIPRWARLAEQVPDLAFRIYVKEQVPELMQQHLGPGNKERIPVYIFLDGNGTRILYWSGRSRIADKWLLARRNRREYPDIPQDEREQLFQDFRTMYRERFRRENFEEIKDALAVAFGIPFGFHGKMKQRDGERRGNSTG